MRWKASLPYRRAQAALEAGVLEEVVPVLIPQRRGDVYIYPLVVTQDKEPNSVNLNVTNFPLSNLPLTLLEGGKRDSC
jgi:hypothetical protein